MERKNFKNLSETLKRYSKLGGDSFKVDGIMVTHPDYDHSEGVAEIFSKFPPNQQPKPGVCKFEFEGPLLLTKAFKKCERIINAITKANFEEQPITSGDPINSFEKHFTFYYPEERFSGILYMYKKSSKSSVLPSAKNVSRFIPNTQSLNPSSTLLVISSPNPDDKNPLVSLNGDALGHPIIKSLNGTCPKIFKVPHHGSSQNSIALQKYTPKNSNLTKKLLATLALLQIALEKNYSLFNDQAKNANRTLLAINNHIKPSRRTRIRSEDLGNVDSEITWEHIAQKFNDALLREKVKTRPLLNSLKTVYSEIKANFDKHDVEIVDVYIHGISDKDTLTAFAKVVYKKVKNSKMLSAYKRAFTILETDCVFSSKIYFSLNRAFYRKINAQTYIISAGNRYSHPNWEVVNGIIAAAHDQHRKNAKYNCRVIITSRKNIKGDKLWELAATLNDDLSKYVSLQCFRDNIASIEIDPDDEVNPEVILDGAIGVQLKKSSFDNNNNNSNNNNNNNNNNNDNSSEVLQNFYQRRGAQELKVYSSIKYEISPYKDETSWLSLRQTGATGTDFNSFELQHTKTQITVERFSVMHDKSIENIVMGFTFSQLSAASVEVFGNYAHTPDSSFQVTPCKLFVYSSNGDKVYMVANNGTLSSTNVQENATVFLFTAVLLSKQDDVTEHLDSPVALTENPAALQFTPVSMFATKDLGKLMHTSDVKVATREDNSEGPMVDSNCTIIQLRKFLELVQHTQSAITCKELWHIIVSQQFTFQFLSEHSDTTIGNFISTIFNFTVDETSTFVFEDFQAVSAHIKLMLPSEQLNLNGYTVNQVTWNINKPKTLEQRVNLELLALNDNIPVAITYLFMIKTYVRYFQRYLVGLGINKNPSIFKMYDALILLLQSGLTAFVYLSSLSRKIISNLLEWNINKEASSVEFVAFPTGPLVISADIIAEIPDDGTAMIDLGLNRLLKINELGFVLPSRQDSYSNPMYLSAIATTADIELQITAYAPDENTLPKLEITPVKPLTLEDIISLLQINTTMLKFTIPLISKALKDIQITEAGFTYQQVMQNSQQLYLHSIHFGINFTNLNKYLPTSFSNLKTISSRIIIYQPKLSFVQIGLEVRFEFSALVSKGRNVSLAALFATEPVMASSNEASSYDFTITVETKSDNVGTVDGGITLDAFLGAFGLAEAFSTAKEMPFLNSILANVELKQLTLTLNTSSRNIKGFILELLVLNWVIIPDKVVVDESYMIMNCTNNKWTLQFDTTVVLNKEYFVNAHFELSQGTQPVKFAFTNSDDDFTISKFLDLFGLGSTGNMPVVKQFLNISVKEVTIEMSKRSDSTVIFNNGSVSFYLESIEIGTLFTLSQVSANIAFVLDSTQDKYIFKFSLNGFINNKVFLDVEYDGSTSLLSGQITISTTSEADLAEILAAVLKEGTESVTKNAVYKMVSQSISLNAAIAMKYNSNNFRLTDVVIHLNKVLSIGPFSLQNLRFEYHNISDVNTQSRDLYKLVGEITSETDSNSIGALLEFDLTTDSTGSSTVKASLRPAQGSRLTLTDLLSLFNIPLPSLPEISGQGLPSFFDIALTKGIITLSVSPLDIIAFQIEVATTSDVLIMESPAIRLNKISLMLDYDKNAIPVTKATLIGILCIGGINLKLQGSKVEGGVIFTMTVADSSKDSIDFQESIDRLTPKDNPSPMIPTIIGIPENLQVLVTQLVIKQLYSPTERSLLLIGSSTLEWFIDLQFTRFTVKHLGGKIFYRSTEKATEFEVYITGKFQFTDSILLTSELHVKAKSDTILSVLTTDLSQVTAASITDDVLGFNHPKDPNNSSIAFQSLLPNTVQSIRFSNFFININFTQSIFFFCGEIVSVGYGFLIAGKFSSDIEQYGYALGISLTHQFKFSDLISALSPIDEILTIEKANCLIVSQEKVKVKEIIAKIKAAKASTESNSNSVISYPFADLNLDGFTHNQELVPGLSIYGEINLNTTKLGSLFNSIIRISQDTKDVPNIIVSAMINSDDPSQSKFKAYITKLTLFGAIEFSDIALSYVPASSTMFELTGTVTVVIGEERYSFIGRFECTSESSIFTVSPHHDLTIKEPLGMFGITLQNALLMIEYDYQKEQPHPTSRQTISADVNFYSTKQSASNSTTTPLSILLSCSVSFNNFIPTVVNIELKPEVPLTIADLIMTIFGWQFNASQYPNIGFVRGHMYYAKPMKGESSVSINGFDYKEGYHISADIEIFTTWFTIQADILSEQISLRGFAHSPLKFGLANFTGVDVNDPSKPDESKSPEVTFITDLHSTSVSLDIGLVLLEFPLGTAKLQYESRILHGSLTYHGKIGFIKDPSIGFEWNEEDGFKVTTWPIEGSFKDAFDFFSKLQHFKDHCGDLVNLAFRESVQTQFNINVKLSKTNQPDKFLADINITGTYDVLLLRKKEIASIPIPDISVGIPIEDNLTLEQLPKFILDLLKSNSLQIIEQITKNPERLAKIIAVSVLKTVTEKVIGTLVCRGVKSRHLESPRGERDLLDDDFDKADKLRNESDIDTRSLDRALKAKRLIEAGKAAVKARILGYAAIGIFAGIVIAAVSILAYFLIDSYAKKKSEASTRKKQIEEKLNENKRRIEKALDIKRILSADFTPPDKLVASWDAIEGEGAAYHVKLVGTILTSGEEADLDYSNSSSTTLYEETISDNHKILQKEIFYKAVRLKLSVNGTLVVNTDGDTYSFDGPVYTFDVPNVFPTLQAPIICAVYHHPSLQIRAHAVQVEFADRYYFELVDNTNGPLTHCTITRPFTSIEVHCVFSHSIIKVPSSFKVRGRAMAKSGSHIASSDYSYSNMLTIVKSIRNLHITLPHFGNQNQMIDIKWDPPTSVENVSGFLYQVVEQKSQKVVLSKEVNLFPTSTHLPITYSCKITDIAAALVTLSPLNDSLQLKFQVCASSNSELIIDSIFMSQLVSLLPSPQSLTCDFSAKSNTLEISWMCNVQTIRKYGLQIRGLNSEVLFSKLVKTSDAENGRVSTNISLADLHKVNDPNVHYSVQVTSVADGNSTMDSLVPGEAASTLKVLQAPLADKLEYISTKESVAFSFITVKDTFEYLIMFHSREKPILANSETLSGEQSLATINIAVDSFIDKASSGDSITGTVQSLGAGYYLSSTKTVFTESLKLLSQPGDVDYSYDPAKETVTLMCSPAHGDMDNYKLGFIGTLQDDTSLTVAKMFEKQVSKKFLAAFSTAELRNSEIHLWRAFAQSTLSDNSTTQLPSPHMFLQQDINVLTAPNIKSVEFNSSYTVLNITIGFIDNVSIYQVHCIMYDSNNSILKEVSKDFEPSNHESILMEIDFNEEIEEWKSTFPKIASVNVVATAIGSGYYLSSRPSKMECIKQQSPPRIQYSYSSSDDMITITCQREDGGTSEVVLGLIDAELGTKRISKIAEQQDNIKLCTVTITGQDVRDEGENVWFVFGQVIGNHVTLPSSLVTLTDPIHTTEPPQNLHAYYDETNATIFLNWFAVRDIRVYKVKVSYASEPTGEKKSFLTTETTCTSLTVDIKRKMPNWVNIFNSVTCVTITIASIGEGLFINSNGKDLRMSRTAPPSDISFSVNEADLIVSWDDRESSVQHTISLNGDYGLLRSSIENLTHCILQKRFLLYPSISLHYTMLDVNVTTKAHGCLPSIPIIKQAGIQAQMIVESKMYGTAGGNIFDDAAVAQSSMIVGIKSLTIYHETSIHGLQAKYSLASGSDYEAPFHGSQVGKKAILQFDKQESIIAVSAVASSVTKLSHLIIATQKDDGSYCNYGPYGAAMPEHPEEEIKFSGNIFVLKGRCSDNCVNAVGFKFTYAHPMVLASKLFGGNRGILFDEYIFTNVPRVVGIKKIQVGYYEEHISTIQLTYILQGGSTFVAAMHGTKTDNTASLQLEDGETVIRVKANKDRSSSGSTDVVKHLSITTQRKDDTISIYNFSPVGAVDNVTFTVTGVLLGLFGYSGCFIDSLGIYYSLLRTELFGGSGGDAFDVESITNVSGIKAIKIWSLSRVASIEVTYLNTAGETLNAVHYGSHIEGAELTSIEFEENEEIVQMYIGTFKNDKESENFVGMLRIITQNRYGSRKEYGPYGHSSVKEFTVNGRVVAFFGRCNWFLDALGMYYIPS